MLIHRIEDLIRSSAHRLFVYSRASMADPAMAEMPEMQYLYRRPAVMDWSDTAATFDVKPTPLDDVLRELATS